MVDIEQKEKKYSSFIEIKKWIFVSKNLEKNKDYLRRLQQEKIDFPNNYSVYIIEKTKTKTVYFDVRNKKIISLWFKKKELDTYTVPISIKQDLELFKRVLDTIESLKKLYWDFYKKMEKTYQKLEKNYLNLSEKDVEFLVKWDIFLSIFILKWLEILEIKLEKWTDNNVIIPQIYLKTIRPIDLLLLKQNWQITEKDYQKYLPEVKKLLKTQLTDEYYKIFLQIPNQFPFPRVTQKELDFYVWKLKEYKTKIPGIWEIVLKLEKPIITEKEYEEYSKRLRELKEKYLWEISQDILNLEEEIKFKSMDDLIEAIRKHKLKEFWKIKDEYERTRDKEKMKKEILEMVRKYYKPYEKLTEDEKREIKKLILWIEVNSK
jgi:hypothetical protein